jgi:hypothetical protein
MTYASTQKMLQFASAVVFGFGLLTAVAALPGLAAPTAMLVDLFFWPFDGAQNLAASESRLLCAILGGTLVGLGTMSWLVATRVYPMDRQIARQIILVSYFTWFVIDSTFSVAAGAPFNIVPNLVFLAMFWLPLARKSSLASA